MTGIVHDCLQWKFVNYKSKSFNYELSFKRNIKIRENFEVPYTNPCP